jgi:hypothetical protein
VADFTNIDAGELNQALLSAHDEIISLRARLAHMELKADAYDTIARIARLAVQEEARGYSVDVAWQIKSLLEKAHAAAAEVADQQP